MVVADLFFAGMVSTSTTLAWALLLMILHPDVQREPGLGAGWDGGGRRGTGWDPELGLTTQRRVLTLRSECLPSPQGPTPPGQSPAPILPHPTPPPGLTPVGMLSVQAVSTRRSMRP